MLSVGWRWSRSKLFYKHTRQEELSQNRCTTKHNLKGGKYLNTLFKHLHREVRPFERTQPPALKTRPPMVLLKNGIQKRHASLTSSQKKFEYVIEKSTTVAACSLEAKANLLSNACR